MEYIEGGVYMTDKENKDLNSEQNEELQRVLVEMKVPKAQDKDLKMKMTAELDSISGFQLDTEYEPIPVPPSSSNDDLKMSLESNDEEIVVVRGTVKTSDIEKLKSQANIIEVWSDPEVEHFGNCPIPPCDCDPRTAKGNIQDVANYLGVNGIWSSGYKGEGIVIGIVDGGVDKFRIPGVIGGWPANWGTRADWGQHGNMTATDALGMAPKSKIYDIRISDSGSGLSNPLQGFHWAITRHKANGTPHILSNSWGVVEGNSDYAKNPNHPFTRKVVEAMNQGILVLFAAGNCGETCPSGSCGSYNGPGKSIWGANGHPKVMTVGAVNKNEQWIGYSSQGPAALDKNKPDFCSISHFKGYFSSDTGTSAACPIAAGVVALLKQAKPSLTQDQVKNALKSTAKDIGPAGFDKHSGAGIINAKAALGKLGIWEKNKKVIGLWAINQDRNAHVYFSGLGWRKISPTNDNIFFNMLSQLIAAKSHGRPVNFYQENGVIKQIYVL